ncbi:hypothetical protein CDD82_6765 [Ophiocordyceps australis]|uniref:Amine oxidase n=1 Tax=Ophiocordyceps australis TaxID=1399860 RepID=A0A2C5XYX1_9HYPO|nr:hypothetical protein CDD82_6765 [Ophiocordyceps australis]
MALYAAAAIVAAQIVAAGVAQPPANGHERCRKTTVAILGGGVAGITAAQALSNESISDFLILEYQDRIGGRAHHTTFGKKQDGSPYTVELGANWARGSRAPGFRVLENQEAQVRLTPPWCLVRQAFGKHQSQKAQIFKAKKHGVANHASDDESLLTYDHGGYNDYSNLMAAYQEASAKAHEQAGRMLANNEQDQTFRTGLSLAGWNPSHSNMTAHAVEYFGWDWDASLPPERSSHIFGAAGNNLTFGYFSPDNLFVTDQRGYSAFVEGEASTFLKAHDKRLLLKTQVTKIDYSEQGVTVHNADGSCVSAAYAICTFSLGVLQSSVIAYQPQLPEWKQQSIHKFDMGTYTKIFLQFNQTFWPSDKQYLLYASPTTRGYYPVWQSLSTEGFMPGSNIIFATVTNKESYRIEQQSDEETKREVLAVLGDMFPNTTIPEPTAFMYPRWTQTAWARGSYSNWPPSTTLQMHQNLRANLGRLWFAGEATSAEFFGYLHGAWFEGRQAGAQIASLLRGRCAVVWAGQAECGARPHYQQLHGTTPLSEYNLLNGWAVSSLGE